MVSKLVIISGKDLMSEQKLAQSSKTTELFRELDAEETATINGGFNLDGDLIGQDLSSGGRYVDMEKDLIGQDLSSGGRYVDMERDLIGQDLSPGGRYVDRG